MNLITLTTNTPPTTTLGCPCTKELPPSPREEWKNLWHGQLRATNERGVHSLVSSIRPQCQNLVVIGIGGSSLGTKAIHTALLDPHWNLLPHSERNGPRLFVLDNVDPKTIQSTYKQIQQDDPSQQHTVVCVISKSGETIEIASNLMVALQKLPRATYVAITGRTGSLRSFAEDQGWPTLDVPEGVGGRFSVLSQVGLFPAAMCGIDISSMLDGANAMAEHCNKPENMASILARYLIGHTIDLRPMHIMMPYCDSLVQCTHWWVQLWAESLGKLNKNTVRVGPTPIAAIGATDQHSVLQLWREGPADKVIGFIHVQEGDDLDLGKRVLFDTTPWLGNKTMREVLTAEQQATAEAVADGDQPTWTLSLEQVSPHTIGQLFALWELTTAYAGNLLQIDPYTQPGVELGKQLTVEKLTTG